MDPAALERLLRAERVGTVVATMGSTATGAVDPLPALLALQQQWGFRLHADAAYGGYFTLASNLEAETREAFAHLSQVDSIVIDPHKHGLQPYGCGCVLFRDPTVGRFYQHDSPYTYFSSKELHLGEISLECSRPGAAAVALWATQRLLPLEPAGVLARGLEDSRYAALELHARIVADPRFIVVWALRAQDADTASRLARRIFECAARRDLHVALAELPADLIDPLGIIQPGPGGTITCLRSVLMKPEHRAWLDRIWKRLDAATDDALAV
jgi:glutamate/tyrosine decarboxylase-like PLP-dependent enzyme